MFCAIHVPEEDWKRRMKACGGAVMTTANDINSSVLGQCDYFEERQVGGERFNIFQGCVNARTSTLILCGSVEKFLEETGLRYMMLNCLCGVQLNMILLLLFYFGIGW
ncbi:T-complex protein 1 subunit eta-like isoform X1 [Eurosta solidaginis]|uniref:T-complex protein 1 subunit eta-like isoform X1 n=2 Tax=Eurosta solidaginis TaxID=178769 RepID=UPI0035309084